MPARLMVTLDDEPLLEIGYGTNVLLPMAESERTAAFVALLNALALLAGLNPEGLLAAKADDLTERPGGSAQYPADRRSGD